MNDSNLLAKKRYNTVFLITLSIISFSTLIIIILMSLSNSPDTFNLKRPVPYLLLPIYLIVRFIFLKMEMSKNINIDRTEETLKLLLFIYFLTIISIKFFPLDGGKFIANLLTVNFLSFFNTVFSIKSIMRAFIMNLILFMPLGFLVPMIMHRFRKISNCVILSLIISIVINALQIVLHYIGLYVINIISLDLLLINIVGTLIGYKFYYYIIDHKLSKTCID